MFYHFVKIANRGVFNCRKTNCVISNKYYLIIFEIFQKSAVHPKILGFSWTMHPNATYVLEMKLKYALHKSRIVCARVVMNMCASTLYFISTAMLVLGKMDGGASS